MWDSLDLRIVTRMYNALSILTYRRKYFPNFIYLLRTKFDSSTGYWILCLHESLLTSCVKLNTLEILYGTEYAVRTHCITLINFTRIIHHSLPWNTITSNSDICLKYYHIKVTNTVCDFRQTQQKSVMSFQSFMTSQVAMATSQHTFPPGPSASWASWALLDL
jgi:hypothetical protein